MALAVRFAAGYKVRSSPGVRRLSERPRARSSRMGASRFQFRATLLSKRRLRRRMNGFKRELGAVDVLIFNGGRRPMDV